MGGILSSTPANAFVVPQEDAELRTLPENESELSGGPIQLLFIVAIARCQGDLAEYMKENIFHLGRRKNLFVPTAAHPTTVPTMR